MWKVTKKTAIISTIKVFDEKLSQLYVRFSREKNSLIIVLFHALFRSEKEIDSNLLDPQQRVTIHHFRQFVEYFLEHNYTFISPEDIFSGLNNDNKYVLITFDDGYFNNQYALQIMNEYETPAMFFISTNNIERNKSFWWDVLYRQRAKQGNSLQDIYSEGQMLKWKKHAEIETYLRDLFGENAFKPISDDDRPFTPSELKQLSEEQYVFIGNHTSDHAILTNYPADEIKGQILSAQKSLYNITGRTPIMISYPNGAYSNEVVRSCKEIGLKLGMTTQGQKNYLPLDVEGNGAMCLNRVTLWGNSQFVKECEAFRSDITLYKCIRELADRWRGGCV